jgi:hypothetical protein
VVVVAAKGMLWDSRRGMRKVAVQPAPRIRTVSSSIFVVVERVRLGDEWMI